MQGPIENGQTPAIAELDYETNLFLGLLGGFAAMFACAVLWGAITFVTEFQISWMALGVGFVVGIAIQKLGRGRTLVFRISGAVLAVLGCLLGNFFFYNGILAREYAAPYFNVLLVFALDPAAAAELFVLAFDPMDLLFYGLAAYLGFTTATARPSARLASTP